MMGSGRAVREGVTTSPTSRAMEKLVGDFTGGGVGGFSILTQPVGAGLSSSVMFSDEWELALSGLIFLVFSAVNPNNITLMF